MTEAKGVIHADPRSVLLDSPMSAFQWAVVLLVAAIAALDGYDILAITVAAPAIVEEWGMNPAALGIVFSIALIGMGVGSFLVAPLADLIGRRAMILITISLQVVGMLLTTIAPDVTTLAACRFLTGIGIGATIAIVNPLQAEFANRKRRDLALSMMSVGVPVGGVIAGLVAHNWLSHDDWRTIFLIGGIFGLVLLALAFLLLPESVAFQIEKPGPRSLERVNRFLTRCGHPAVAQLPAPAPKVIGARPLEIFAPGNVGRTFHVSAIVLFFAITIYFFLSWTPQMVVRAGFLATDAAKVMVTQNVCGIVAGLMLGWAAARLPTKWLGFVALVGGGIGLIFFGQVPADLGLITLTASITGAFLHPTMVTIHALISSTYPPHLRASGAGFSLGMARIGSAIGPAAAGFLFNGGMDNAGVTMILSLGALTAAVLLFFFRVDKASGHGEHSHSAAAPKPAPAE